MFSRRFFALALSATLLSACVSAPQQKTRIDYDKAVDFAVYRTYGFPKETGTDRGGYSTLMTSYFKSSISTAMEARGYKYAAEHPDLLVNFFMNTTERTESRGEPTLMSSYGYFGYRRGLYSPWPYYENDRTETYKVGTANIDIVDAEKKQLVWEGVSEGRLGDEEMINPKVSVNAVVTDLMRQYPGRPGM
jgi:hypothetical protein